MIEEFLSNHGYCSTNKKFKELTTVKMGGDIAYYVEPYSMNDLKEIIDFLKNHRISFKVIGNGSNLICGSNKYNGVVIKLNRLNNYQINDDDTVYVESGVMIPFLSRILANEGLSGLEFASGIPGNFGGLTYMNAGAYLKEMKDVIVSVNVLRDNEIITMSNEELDFSYRDSIFKHHPHWVILSGIIKVERKNKEEILELIENRFQRRKTSQPIEAFSAGSCFRNPSDNAAWKLIDSIGYRGYKLNGVEVSNKHSNFIVNTGNGKSEDYLAIAYDIQQKIKDKYGINLILEVEKFNC